MLLIIVFLAYQIRSCSESIRCWVHRECRTLISFDHTGGLLWSSQRLQRCSCPDTRSLRPQLWYVANLNCYQFLHIAQGYESSSSPSLCRNGHGLAVKYFHKVILIFHFDLHFGLLSMSILIAVSDLINSWRVKLRERFIIVLMDYRSLLLVRLFDFVIFVLFFRLLIS